MLIRKHWKLPYLLRALGDTAYTQWVRPLRSLPVEALIAAPAALAGYIADQPAFLAKPTLHLAVLGTALDAADGGAWWSIIGSLLGKPADWCQCYVFHHDDGDLSMQIRPPALVKTHVHVAKGDLRDLGNLPTGIDLAFLPVSTPNVLDLLLGSENHLWPLLNAGTALIAGFTHDHEVSLHSALGKVFGLELAQHQNRFITESLPIQTLVIATGTEPPDLERRINDAEWLASAADVIAEVCADNLLGNQQPDAFTTWGTEALIKSSADSTDTYIALPRQYAVRRRTGVVYLVQNDLAIGDGYPGRLPPEAFADLPPDATWASRIAWAAAAWRSGVGKMVNSTLGGAIEAAGFDRPNKEQMRDLMTRLGVDGQHIDAISDALGGGEHYGPTQRERQVLDRLKAGDAPGLLKLLEEDKALLTTMDETRLPLLTAAGRRGMLDVMRRMLALGTPVDIRDGDGRTAMAELATTGRSVESVKMLLDAGANPNAVDTRGWTALLLALKTGRWENAMLLLDRGADPTICNIVGLSAVAFVRGDYPRELEQEATDLMRQLTGFDVAKAQKQAGIIDDAPEIPSGLRERILSTR
jgi:hypothetical protein